MMTWTIEYITEAQNDLAKLDHSQRMQVLKAIKKVAENPLSQAEGGYGKPLGSRQDSRLAGYFKIKLLKLGLRIVYGLVREQSIMRIIIISVRDDEQVYRLAEKRTN